MCILVSKVGALEIRNLISGSNSSYVWQSLNFFWGFEFMYLFLPLFFSLLYKVLLLTMSPNACVLLFNRIFMLLSIESPICINFWLCSEIGVELHHDMYTFIQKILR